MTSPLEDKKKGIGTLPVRIGEKAARYLNIAVFILIYAHHPLSDFCAAIFHTGDAHRSPGGKRLLYSVGALTKPRPAEPPKEWPGWPTWFSGFAFYHNRLFENLFLLGLLADTLLRLFTNFWPVR